MGLLETLTRWHATIFIYDVYFAHTGKFGHFLDSSGSNCLVRPFKIDSLFCARTFSDLYARVRKTQDRVLKKTQTFFL